MTETLSIKVPKEMKNRLHAEAKRRKTQPSALMREALELVLAGERDGLTCHDLAGDLLESLDGGPSDLSTNKKYLKGFGK